MQRMNISVRSGKSFGGVFLSFLSCSVLIQKRLKKEKRSKRRLQEALEEEVKLRDQAEHTLLHTANAHTGEHRLNLSPQPPRSLSPPSGGPSLL